MRAIDQNATTEANKNFENAVKPYMKDLKNYCRSLMKSTWDGEDLMQDTLTKAYKSYSTTLNPVSKSYLFRIASNTWIDGNRKQRLNEDFNKDVSELADKKTNSDILIEGMQLLLEELSPKQRTAVLLVDGFNYTMQETSIMMRTTEGAVKAVLHRARRKIKQVRNQATIYSEDDNVKTYITAFQSGKPEMIVDLFRKEIGEPRMVEITTLSGSNPKMTIQPIVGFGTSYVIVTLRKKDGNLVCIPFYRSEWLAFFTQLKEELFLAA
ncbi:RNA polymerase sigma factor [Bacillus sp. NPDC077027]|uniref:RNA polymerase sigma factor n=1 Tax=Bacillus sp. NPDC077027 TaxID=3390548 RepID=UPI003D004A69